MKTPIYKKILPKIAAYALLAATTIALPSACVSDDPLESANTAVANTTTLKKGIEKQATQIEATLSALQKVLTTSGDAMVDNFSDFSATLDKFQKSRAVLVELHADWLSSHREHLTKWRLRQSEIQDESMRKTSAANRNAYTRDFEDASRSVEESLRSLDILARRLEDTRKFLHHNLTVKSAQNAIEDSIKTTTIGAATNATLRATAKKLDTFATATTPGA